PLGAAIAGVGAKGGKREGAEAFEFPGGGFDEQADFPMAGVIAQRDGFSIGRADAALGAEEEKRFARGFAGVPAHAGVLSEAEDVAARTMAEVVVGQRQASDRTGGFGFDLEEVAAIGGEGFSAKAHGGERRMGGGKGKLAGGWRRRRLVAREEKL